MTTSPDPKPSPTLVERVRHDFTLHPPQNERVGADMDDFRERFKSLAMYVAAFAPAGREQSLALTHLEEGLFWAIAAIARNQGGTDD